MHMKTISLKLNENIFRDTEILLDSVFLTANKNKIPYDPQPAAITSGIRLGTPAATSRGFREEEMEKIAELIYLTATDYNAKAESIRDEVNKLCAKYPLYD